MPKKLKSFAEIKKEAILKKQKKVLSAPNTLKAIQDMGDEAGIKVSAIVSTYNSEKFIRGCLSDLLQQTLYRKGELEIIVIDSGSQENENVIVKKYQQKYNNIRYIRTPERETVYAAWNRGIKAASGMYITNANTDDRHRGDALEVMASVLDKKPEIVLVYADVLVTKTENEAFEHCNPVSAYKWPDYNKIRLLTDCYIGPQPMWRKSLHNEHGYFDEMFEVAGDLEYWLRIAQDTNFYHIHEYLGLYLNSSQSIEHAKDEKKNMENLLIFKRHAPNFFSTAEDGLAWFKKNIVDEFRVAAFCGYMLVAFQRYNEALEIYESYLQKYPNDQRVLSFIKEIKESII